MLKLTFLSADQPLAKSYSRNNKGELQKESYPRVWEFTSHEASASTLGSFHDLLLKHAALGHCLLKGEIQRSLACESRAGSTDPNTLTRWIMLDFDRLPQGTSIVDALTQLGFADHSYILQYSASHGIEPDRGDTAHVILELSAPLHPASLKQWLIHLNLSTPFLVSSLGLTKTNNALSWGLDVTTCQNDKLLYIAPPILGPGVENTATGERVSLHTGRHARVDVAKLHIPSAEQNRAAMDAKLDELRAALGLAKRKWEYRIDKGSGLEVLHKPDAATLTGVKRERGFTYFNLNGGDSWGYYHHNDAPDVIHNFKGEPDYLTAQLLPEYWAQLEKERRKETAQIRELLQNPGMSSGPQVLVFRDFKTALYYNGTWNPETKHLELARAASELQIQHYLKERKLPEIDWIPTWNLIYDPQSDVRVDVERKVINTFEASPYMQLKHPAVMPTAAQFPTIDALIEQAVGRNPLLKEHWLNWWACIFRYRVRTMIAWILHGLQGTGKGLLVNHVLIPLLGAGNVVVKRMQELEDQFNDYLSQALLVVIDESQISESRSSRMIMANLKNMITEPQISIRRMRTAAYTVPNHCNFLFLSNQPDPVQIEASDRRFNVAEFRDEKLEPSQEYIAALSAELEAFALYSAMRPADLTLARTVFESEERATMMAASTNSIDATAQALLTGDLEFFWDALPAGQLGILGPEAQMLHEVYTKLIYEAIRGEGPHRITRDELRVLFAYNVGDVPKTPAKFTSMLRHHRVHLRVLRVGSVPCRGVEVMWKKEASWLKERLSELKEKMPALKAVG